MSAALLTAKEIAEPDKTVKVLLIIAIAFLAGCEKRSSRRVQFDSTVTAKEKLISQVNTAKQRRRAKGSRSYYRYSDTTTSTFDTLHVSPFLRLLCKRVVRHNEAAAPSEFRYFQTFQFFEIGGSAPLQTIPDSGREGHDFDFRDIDADGYADLKIQDDMWNLYTPSNVWLFNPKTNRFVYSEILSGESDLSSNSSRAFSSNSPSTGGRGGYSEKFMIEGGEKKIIESTSSNYFEYEKKQLIDGQLRIVARDFEVPSLSDSTITVISEKLLFDSLRVVKQITLFLPRNQNEIRGYESAAIESQPFGSYVITHLVTFEYEKDENGSIRARRNPRKLVGKKLVVSSE